MDPRRLHGQGQKVRAKATIKWSYQMKQAVHLMYTDCTLNLDPNSRPLVFTALFSEQLRARGVHSVQSRVIVSQYGERHKPNRTDWTRILAPPSDSEAALSRVALRDRIQEIVESLEPPSSGTKQRSTQRTDGTALQCYPVEPVTDIGRKGRLVATCAKRPASTSIGPSAPEKRRKRAFVKPPARQINTEPEHDTLSSSASPNRHCPITPPQSASHRVSLTRNDGSTIFVTPKQSAMAQGKQMVVNQHRAHPPNTGLLFRYWRERSPLDHDSYNGFVARKYFQARFWPEEPPPSQYIDVTDVGNHMNRDHEKTPFISTTVRLVWILSLAMKDLKAGVTNGRITIIDRSALNSQSVFYAPPFHAEAKRQCGFDNGAQRYPGTSEYLVWRDIPRQALIHTFAVQDFHTRFSEIEERGSTLSKLLQLRTLMQGQASLTKLVRGFQAKQTALTDQLVAEMAGLVLFFGLTAKSSYEHIAHVVSDVVQGWGVKVTYRDNWNMLADGFFRSLCEKTGVMAIEERYKVAFAFLHGVHWGLGDLNARHDPIKTANVSKKAAAIGLRSPAEILARNADAEKMRSLLLEKAHDRNISSYHAGQHLLLGSSHDALAERSDEPAHRPRSGNRSGILSGVLLYNQCLDEDDDVSITYED